jgi:tetratricopeptide (TPR) repeat protein
MHPTQRAAFEALKAAQARALETAQLQVVLVGGASGSGKSALLEAFAREVQGDLVRLAAGPRRRAPVIDGLIRARLRLGDAVDLAALEARLQAQPELASDPEQRALATAAFSIVTGDTGREALSRWEAAGIELLQLIRRATARGPVVALIDDVDQADTLSAAWLEGWLKSEPSAPGLLVLSVRTENQPAWLTAWQSDARVVQLALEGPPLPSRLDALPLAALQLGATLARLGPRLPLGAAQALVPQDASALEALLSSGVLAQRPSALLAPQEELDFRSALERSQLQARPDPLDLVPVDAWLQGALSHATDLAARELLPLLAHTRGARGDVEGQSLTHELLADLLGSMNATVEALRALQVALPGASGVRRAVLTRRVADAQLVGRGGLAAQETIAALGSTLALSTMPVSWAPRFGRWPRRPLDTWEQLPVETARVALEICRAEALSLEWRTEQALSALRLLGDRLERYQGPCASNLWVRWAKSFSFCLTELEGTPVEAEKVYARMRARVSAADLASDENAAGLLRAEEIVASRLGDRERAMRLSAEQLALAQAHGNLHEESVALNAIALQHMGSGELTLARAGFERALKVSRRAGSRRREAVALHNLGLVLGELGEDAAARDAKAAYMACSASSNNAAHAYGPASLVNLEIDAGRLDRAEKLIAQARSAAEKGGWGFLITWTRGLTGQVRLARWLLRRDALTLSQARNDLLACVDALEERVVSWTEELDPGEIYALLALVHHFSGATAAAEAALVRGKGRIAASCVSSHAWLDVAQAVVSKAPVDPALAWFESRGYVRASRSLRRLLGAGG